MCFDIEFRELIQDLSISNNHILIKSLIDLLQDKVNYLPLRWYFIENKGNIVFNKEFFDNSIEKVYSKSVLFITDMNKEYNGGKDFFKFDGKYIEQEKWENYIQTLKDDFWANIDSNEKDIFNKLSNFEVFDNKEPKNDIEKLILLNNPEYKFFNQKEWTKYYDNLMKHFFSVYKLNNKISNSTKKRYVQLHLENKDMTTSIYWNKGLFVSELKKGYLELRPMEIEILSTDINRYYPVEEYLIYNENAPLVRVSLSQGFANLIAGRIGDYTNDAEMLKKDFYLFFKVYSNYMNIFLKYTEHILAAY